MYAIIKVIKSKHVTSVANDLKLNFMFSIPLRLDKLDM